MNKKFKKVLMIGIWLIFIAIISFLIVVVHKRQKNLKCKNLIINLTTNESRTFITTEDINKCIFDSVGNIIGKPIKEINLLKIHKIVSQIPFLKNTTVFKTLSGEIKIEVSERKPIAHVFTKNNESFYIDDEGVLIPTSKTYTSNVITVCGEIYETYSPLLDLNNPSSINNNPILYKVYVTALYISDDEFWDAMIDQIYVNRRGEIELIPKPGKHNILIGNIDKLEKKFERLMVFYEKVIKKIGWDVYETINLKFDNQIVCTTKTI